MSDDIYTNVGKINPEAAAKERQEVSSRGLGDYFKLEPGRTFLRFLPPPAGRDLPFYRVWIHWLRGPDGKITTCGCPRKLEGRLCLACNEAFRLRRTKDPLDAKAAIKMGAKTQVYAQVVDVTTEASMAKGVRAFPFGPRIYQELLAYLTDETDPVDFTDPAQGFVVIIDREGTGELTEYKVKLERQPTSLRQAALLAILRPKPGEKPVAPTKEQGARAIAVAATWLPAVKDLMPLIKLQTPEQVLVLEDGAPGGNGQALVPASPAPTPSSSTAMAAAAEPAGEDGPAWYEEPVAVAEALAEAEKAK